MKRIGVVAIVVKGDRSVSVEIQRLLNDFQDIIIGRMGLPDHKRQISTISLIVEGGTERISALTGKLGRLENINVKSAITAIEIEE